MGIIGLGLGVTLVGIAPADLFILAIIGNLVLGLMIPIANGPIPAATAAAEPALEPPDVSAVFQGLRVSPKTGLPPRPL